MKKLMVTAAIILSAGAAHATESVCYKFYDHLYMSDCVRFTPDVPTMKQRLRYPDQIVITRKKDWEKANANWNVVPNCHREAKKSWMHDDRINLAKFYYCELPKHGISLPKPEILKGF